MLQRAASNAYSWWWASHIRTKQSKWLEQNLQDMEERVGYTLKIIHEDGDTFSQRAEMYYRKRPEIVGFVEEAFRSYRALAERYDHLSRDFQRANRTIASVFPDQVPIPLDNDDDDDDCDHEDDEDDDGGGCEEKQEEMEEEAKANGPSVPEMPKRDFRSPSMLLSRKGTLRRNPSSVNKTVMRESSGLSRSEGLEEINRLQKGILALQTEKEFVKSEDEMNEMQKRVCDLQDEFRTEIVIDDSNARALMAATTIKSCKESLAKLEDKQKQSEEVAEFAKGRVGEALEKFEALKKEFLNEQSKHRKTHTEESESEFESAGLGHEPNLESPGENIKQDLEVDLSVARFAEKIDQLVGNVVSLETAASSQTALVNSLRSETEELHMRIRGLQEEKETLVSGSEYMNKRVAALERDLCRIKTLCLRFEEENMNLRTNFVVLSCNADHLSGNLHSARMDEDKRTINSEAILDGSTDEVDSVVEARREVEIKEEKNKNAIGDEDGIKIVVETNKPLEPALGEKPQTVMESRKSLEQTYKVKPNRRGSSEATSVSMDTEKEESSIEEDEDQPTLGQLLKGRSGDTETDLLDEYTSVVESYKEVKRKLSDVEKKNRDGFFELALQMRELKNAVNNRDVEIENPRDKVYPVEKSTAQADRKQSEHQYLNRKGQQQSHSQLMCSPASSFSSPGVLQEHNDPKKHTAKEEDEEVKAKLVVETPYQISAVQKIIREHIDTLLEENLECWLTFAASVHQIQRFQTTVHDLELELRKKNENRLQQSNEKSQSNTSDVRPIYRNLREIKTEMQLWLENNEVLKHEVQTRYSSLCGIQDEISKLTSRQCSEGNMKLNEYQAAKFHGEVLGMKQESSRVSNELQRSLDRVRMLKIAVERILATVKEDLGISAAKNAESRAHVMGGATGRPRIPLRSFLFGVKLKKQREQKISLLS